MIRNFSIILVIFGFVFCTIIPQNSEKNEFLAEVDSLSGVDSLSLDYSTDLKNHKYKYPGRAMLLSGVLPGLGEIYAGSYLMAFLFAGIEASAWYYNFKTQNEMELKEAEYKKFADDHWDFSRWVTHYYDFYNYIFVAA